MQITGKGANAPRKPEACKAKYAKQKITIKYVYKEWISEQNPKGRRKNSTVQHHDLRGEAHWQTNKRVQKGEGNRRDKHYTKPKIARRSTLHNK